MNWAEPHWWWLLLAVALSMFALWWTSAWHIRKLGRLFGDVVLARVLPPAVIARRQARDALAITGLLLLVIALVEPRFGKRLVEIEAEGVDLVLIVDLSRSMDATDVDPSRLERARREVLDMVDLFEGDRVGLVVYAGGPYPRMPLTLDYSALRMVVRELDTRTFQAQGSALGLAIDEGLELLSHQQGTAGRAMVVLTDGEVHEPETALEAARRSAEAGVAIYGLVIGTDAAPIPNGDGTFLTDPNTGTQVLTQPTTDVLRDVARVTGGAVVQSVASNADVVALYRDTIRPSLRTAVGRRGQRETWTSAFQWPLGVGLFCLLLSAWLGDGKRVVVLVALFALMPSVAQAQTTRDGDLAYRQGRYDEAVRIFTELTLEQPDNADLQQRLGAARYRAGDYVGAARAFERQDELSDNVDADFNAGNAYWQAGQLDRALERYEDVLSQVPEHPGATANRQMLTQEMQRRQMMQQKEHVGSEEGDEQQEQQGEPGEGDPSQGKGEPGEPKPEPGESGKEQGSPQQGDSQEQPGEEQDPGDASSSGSPQGEPGEQDAGTRNEDPEEGDGTQPELEDLQAGEEGAEGTPGEGGGGKDGTPVQGDPNGMTPEQADRVLDGVEEGRPRVYIPGERGSKPW